jgi:2'-5' RNA ligase
MTRTFIAIELNEEVRSYLHQEVQRFTLALPRVRWVDPAILHLTLAFLGELDDARLAKAINATLEVASMSKPFTLRIGSPGTFGPPQNPRVVWIGLAGNVSQLFDLQARLAASLVAGGFPPEERSYVPHLTLARIKSPLTSQELVALRRIITPDSSISTSHNKSSPSKDQGAPGISVEHLSVMSSNLTRADPQYTVVCTCPFGG